MANQNEPNVSNNQVKNNDDRNMWIACAVIVVILLGGMGINMLVHHDTSADTVETTSPYR